MTTLYHSLKYLYQRVIEDRSNARFRDILKNALSTESQRPNDRESSELPARAERDGETIPAIDADQLWLRINASIKQSKMPPNGSEQPYLKLVPANRPLNSLRKLSLTLAMVSIGIVGVYRGHNVMDQSGKIDSVFPRPLTTGVAKNHLVSQLVNESAFSLSENLSRSEYSHCNPKLQSCRRSLVQGI